jgi:hypothetical protein
MLRSQYDTLDALRRVQSFLDAQTTAPRRIMRALVCVRPAARWHLVASARRRRLRQRPSASPRRTR